MAKYEQYNDFKESFLVWMGDVPKHWEINKFKWIFQEKTKTLNPSLPAGSISFGNVVYKDEKNLSPDTKASYQEVLNGEYLINPLNLNFDLKSLRTALSQIDVVVSTGYIVLTDNGEFNKQYLRWLLYEFDVAHMKKLGSGVRQTINYTDIANSLFFHPEFNEQVQIANFLDYETAQIDTLIEKQQTLIQLLKEKRQAVISHAVTKGLNPDAPMKDSGVEWLGEVPEHWDIVKLKWKASTTSGGTPTTSKYEDYYEDGDIPWIRTTDLNNDKLNETPIMITPKAVRDSACSLLPKNSVLIAMYGGAGSIGKHSLLNFESTINQAVCGVLPSDAFVPDYLHRFYEFYRPFWMIGAAGTRKDPNIGQDNIKEARVPIPPLSEQHQIADYLDKMQSHFDALTESAEKGIQLMQERRTALISAAVTGKIDVRGWVAPE